MHFDGLERSKYDSVVFELFKSGVSVELQFCYYLLNLFPEIFNLWSWVWYAWAIHHLIEEYDF